jgi:asparagine synthase (glutamine-hydrolysing)
MPHDIAYRRTKIGFNSPIVDWMRGPLRGFFMDVIGSQSFRECELVDARRARRLVEHVVNDDSATFKAGESAWWSVLPYLWYEAMFAGSPEFRGAGQDAVEQRPEAALGRP